MRRRGRGVEAPAPAAVVHSLHHLENHLDCTPMQYIQERFREGQDKELAMLKCMVITEEEQLRMKEVGMVHDVTGRQQRGKAVWYEVIKSGRRKNDAQWYPLSEIELTMPSYVLKLIKNHDDRANCVSRLLLL